MGFDKYVWLHLRHILYHIHTLSTLFLNIYISYDEEEENSQVSIDHISSLMSLTNLHLDCESDVDLAQFFGKGIFQNLKILKLTRAIFLSSSTIFHLFPNLYELHLEYWDEPDLFSSLPPSLRKLVIPSDLLEDLRHLNGAPLHLIDITITESRDLDYSVLPFIPANIQELKLHDTNMNSLEIALRSFRAGELKLGRLQVDDYYPKGRSEEVVRTQWEFVLKECNRLGIGLEKMIH